RPFPPTLTGMLPTYGHIGNFSPILLLVLRLIQGFGAGAEFAGAAILAVEFSPPQRRGFFGSWSQIGVAIGLAAAVGAFWLAHPVPGKLRRPLGGTMDPSADRRVAGVQANSGRE